MTDRSAWNPIECGQRVGQLKGKIYQFLQEVGDLYPDITPQESCALFGQLAGTAIGLCPSNQHQLLITLVDANMYQSAAEQIELRNLAAGQSTWQPWRGRADEPTQ